MGIGTSGRRLLRRATSEQAAAVALIIPSLVAVGVFVYGFIGWSALVSVSEWDTIRPDYTYVGLDNFRDLFRNFRFQIDIRNTVVFTVLFVAACLGLGFVLASLLDRHVWGEGIFRSIYLFPMAVSFIVTGVVWRWLLAPRAGVNILPEKVGLGALDYGWYTDPTVTYVHADSRLGEALHAAGLGFLADPNYGIPLAMISVVIAATWQMSGFVMVMYLAGLRAIPEELREAARMDGASEFRILRHISLPLLRPVTLSAIIILGHQSLKIFDLVMSMSRRGPGFATDVPALFMFETSFQGNHFSHGAAISIVMLVAVSALVIPYLFWSLRREAHL
ncbi:MAG: sugar ABC transporter permease [Chloroflexi bacterium]|nr:sugar ABC transporter permease [Chloroflexota bacterium]